MGTYLGPIKIFGVVGVEGDVMPGLWGRGESETRQTELVNSWRPLAAHEKSTLTQGLDG